MNQRIAAVLFLCLRIAESWAMLFHQHEDFMYLPHNSSLYFCVKEQGQLAQRSDMLANTQTVVESSEHQWHVAPHPRSCCMQHMQQTISLCRGIFRT